MKSKTTKITRADYFRRRAGLLGYGHTLTSANQDCDLWLKANGTSNRKLFG